MFNIKKRYVFGSAGIFLFLFMPVVSYASGTIFIKATLDGAPWPASGSVSMSYSITGADNLNGTQMPATFLNVQAGSYNFNWSGGGPTGGSPTSIQPSSSQILFDDNAISYTLNFFSAFDYNLTATSYPPLPYAGSAKPGDIIVVPGNSSGNTIHLNYVSGTPEDITLSLSGLGAISGATNSFSAPKCKPNCTSDLTITVPISAATGAYPLTVTGMPLGKTVNFTLYVEPFDYDLTSVCPSTSLSPGSSTVIPVSANLIAGTPQLISMIINNLLPSGVTGTFVPSNKCTPTCAQNLQIDVSNSAVIGTTFDIVVKGTHPGRDKFSVCTATIGAFDYSLGKSKDINIQPGGSSDSSTITATLTSGTTKTLTLVNSSLPSGVSGGLSSCNPGSSPTCSAVLTLSASNSATTGSYTVTVTSSTGGTPPDKQIPITVSVGNLPNLQTQSFSKTGQLIAGQTLTFDGKWKTQSPTSRGPLTQQFVARYCVSKGGPATTNDCFLGNTAVVDILNNFTVPPLASLPMDGGINNNLIPTSAAWTIPPGNNSFNAFLCLDVGNVVAESAGGEGDNCTATGSFTVPQCADGINNDAPEDTLIDAVDPGCHTNGNASDSNSYDATDNDERDSLCGNGVVDTGEQCDGADLSGKTCVALGYSRGTLSCTPSCKFDLKQCLTIKEI